MAYYYRFPNTGAILLNITYVIISFVELMIGIRIILKLFGARAAAPFVSWVYATTAPLLQPFAGMFPSPVIEGRFIIEFSALFALIAYAVIAFLSNLVLPQFQDQMIYRSYSRAARAA